MNMPLLDIQPRTLKFVVDLMKQSSCVVQLTNTTQNYVAFKVKTTSPKKYCVRPNVGVVAPNASCEFTVIMQAFKEPPQDMVCRDKFLVQSTAVPAETTDEDITASTFSKAEGKHIEENKLRVSLVPPSDSPELSPINRTLNQQAEFEESSILKDRLYTQPEILPPPQYESEIVKEPKIVGHDELKVSSDTKSSKSSKGSIVDSTEDVYSAKETKGGINTLKETEFEPIKPNRDLDAPTKKAIDVPEEQGFTNGILLAKNVADLDEPTIVKDRDVAQVTNDQNVKALDEFKLARDIEEMKRKVNALESKLKQADSTISKLMDERSISSQHRQSLQQELAELRTKKVVKEVHIGFPLLFVCTVAFISIVVGYCLRG